MAIIYKGYLLSKSLYGSQLYYIARNSSRVVVIREKTEEKLKKAIDERIKHQEEEKLTKDKVLADKAKTKKRGFFQSKENEILEVEDKTHKVVSKSKSQSKVLIKSVRTEKPLLENELRKQVEEAKKSTSQTTKKESFWDRLK